MYSCPSCGAGLVFDPKTQKLLCKSCRKQYDPENIENVRLDKAKEIKENIEGQNENTKDENKSEYQAYSYKCSHCGAELITTDETITTFCSFCRTGTMLDRKEIKKRKPDFIIPFKITKEECKNIYKNKIKSAVFAPKSMIEEQEIEKIRGIYMPYWIYSFEKNGTIGAKGSKYKTRMGDYLIYDDYMLTTKVEAKCEGITHDGAANFYDRLSEAIAPFSIKEKKEFSEAYLSGYYADNEDVDNSTYISESEKIVEEHITNILAKEKEYRRYNAKPSIQMDKKEAKLALFPVYFISTKNRSEDRISYAVINGQTGKIVADIPIDFKKFITFSAVFALIIFVILSMFLTISMPKLIISSIIFNFISLFILLYQNNKINILENELDDKGVRYKKLKEDTNKIKNNKSIKIDMSYLKPIIGLLITFIIFTINPADDIYYYISAFVSIGLTIWSFNNIMEKLNILTTRKLPQLGKRGGDENA